VRGLARPGARGASSAAPNGKPAEQPGARCGETRTQPVSRFAPPDAWAIHDNNAPDIMASEICKLREWTTNSDGGDGSSPFPDVWGRTAATSEPAIDQLDECE
jgi:hypothetical protein